MNLLDRLLQREPSDHACRTVGCPNTAGRDELLCPPCRDRHPLTVSATPATWADIRDDRIHQERA